MNPEKVKDSKKTRFFYHLLSLREGHSHQARSMDSDLHQLMLKRIELEAHIQELHVKAMHMEEDIKQASKAYHAKVDVVLNYERLMDRERSRRRLYDRARFRRMREIDEEIISSL